MKTKQPSRFTLELSLKRLEAIVEKLENGEVPLDEAVDLYEEGIRISTECAEKLKTAEQRIRKLTKDANGKLALSEADES